MCLENEWISSRTNEMIFLVASMPLHATVMVPHASVMTVRARVSTTPRGLRTRARVVDDLPQVPEFRPPRQQPCDCPGGVSMPIEFPAPELNAVVGCSGSIVNTLIVPSTLST
jgi:hypothetical protein